MTGTPHRQNRALLVYTIDEVAEALGIDGDGDVYALEWQQHRAQVVIGVRRADLPPVAEACEPPIIDRSLLTHPNRYRLAWLSARRRAQHLRDVLGLVDDVPIDLVLDETTETVTWHTPEAQAEHHTTDLVLAGTTRPGVRYWTCPHYDHQTTRVDFVHTTGPCPDLEAPA